MKKSPDLPSKSSTKALIIVDDQSLRKKFFFNAAQILKKIERLEKERDSFSVEDQRLYESWYNLTFRKDLERAQDLQQEFEELARFHNSALALAQMREIPLYEAVHLLRREQVRYEKATPAQKARIEEERGERERFMKKILEEARRTQFESQFDFNSDFGLDDDEEDDLDEDDSSRRRKTSSSLPPPAKDAYRLLLEYSFEDLQEQMDMRDGFFFFLEAFNLALLADDAELALLVWEAASPSIQKKAIKEFKQSEGISLKDLLARLRKKVAADPASDDSEDLDPRDVGTSDKAPSYSAADRKLDVKALYRKLVRRLHPDVANVPTKTSQRVWMAQAWHQVQAAYKAEDVDTLRRLDLISVIRLEDLRSLTLDEIQESAFVLEEEFEQLKFSLSDLRKHPAWKFSKKKSYDSLKKKIRGELEKGLAPLRRQVEELRDVYEGVFRRRR